MNDRLHTIDVGPVQIQCPACRNQFGGQMPGHKYGSNWAFVPCQTCSGTGWVDAVPPTAPSPAPIDCDHCGSTEDVHEHHTNPACGIDGQPCKCDTEAFCPNCCVCEQP